MKSFYCGACEINMPSLEAFRDHSRTKSHRFNYLQTFYTTNRDFMVENKEGIKISVQHPKEDRSTVPSHIREEDGNVVVFCRGAPENCPIYIHNTNEKKTVLLRQIELLYPSNKIELSDEHGVCKGERIVSIKEGRTYKVDFNALNVGVHAEACPAVFEFKFPDEDETFCIFRILVVEILDEVSEMILESKPYSKLQSKLTRLVPPKVGEFVKGAALSTEDEKIRYKLLFRFYYDSLLRELVDARFDPMRLPQFGPAKKMYHELVRLMNEGLNPTNYQEWFQTQLSLEEVQKEMDLGMFHQTDVSVKILDDPCFSLGLKLVELKVPGLIEKRPNILKGDSVFFRYKEESVPIYEGIVHKIKEEIVYLGFDQDFVEKIEPSTKFDVQFWFNRVSIIRKHRALTMSDVLTDILFPNPALASYLPSEEELEYPSHELTFFDARVRDNREQCQAVTMIVNQVSRPHPYIIFGPPGTGKTLTIVEAMKQVYVKDSMSRILVCGPSNSSCDVVAQRLMKDIPKEHILRINALSRDAKSIPRDVAQVSFIEDGIVKFPTAARVDSFRIVIATFTSAAKVVPAFCHQQDEMSDFTHVFMDEVGYGEEPEALIPLLALPTLAVLAGDPKQLGPVIANKMCLTNGQHFSAAGLDQSLLERLMNIPPYSAGPNGEFNARFVTKLLDNFRSHPKILEVPNKLFYNSQLRAKASKPDVTCMLDFNSLPNKKVPIIFHGVNGRDSREDNCPSFFNVHEVSEVVNYVKALRRQDKKPSDVGIISPYKTQIHKIRDALHKHVGNWSFGIRVGSPEEFQGDERKVIIVSTVRASAEHLKFDKRLQLGFLCNPKRFNVVVTRAQALLIIIGSPYLLKHDDNWGTLLKFASDNQCYKGCALEELPSEIIEDVYDTLRDVNIHVDEAEGC